MALCLMNDIRVSANGASRVHRIPWAAD
jgi:hypothetical protein